MKQCVDKCVVPLYPIFVFLLRLYLFGDLYLRNYIITASSFVGDSCPDFLVRMS